jgi:hypothetical protein
LGWFGNTVGSTASPQLTGFMISATAEGIDLKKIKDLKKAGQTCLPFSVIPGVMGTDAEAENLY